MSSITSSSNYSATASASSSKGLSGLISGINTEEMVTKLLSGTQAKIDKQKGNKQVLTWQQSTYRDVITSLNTFKQNFFSYTSETNLLSSSFFNSMAATSSSPAVKVSAGNTASGGQMIINKVTDLATSHCEKSANTVSGTLTGQIDFAKLAALEVPAELKINLDGIQKTIRLDTTIPDVEAFKNNLQTKINQAFGSGLNVSNVGDALTFDTADSSRQVTLTGSEEVMAALGNRSGVSNKINLNTKLKDLNLSTALAGEAYSFKINGVTIEATSEDSLNTLINRINSSEANVKVSYSSIEDKFLLTSTVSGKMNADDDYRFKLENQVGNVLSALFGTEGSGSLAGKSLATTDAEGASSVAASTTLLSDLGLSGEIQIKTIVDPPGTGTSTTIDLNDYGTVADLIEGLNTALGGTSEAPKAVFDTETARIQILGIEVPTEIVGLDETGALTLESIFGNSKVDLKTAGVATTITEQGENAQLTVNGIDIERASNSFTLDGLTIDLLKETDDTEPITLDTTRNTDKIVEGIKKFIDEYNGLLDKLNGLVDAEATYKQYPPLTAEQKKEMSENEIKLWEEKAQEGLLRKDENITRALSKMRTALYSKPEGGKYALYDLGIETGSWAEKGKLHIKEPPTALLEALASNPQDIEKLFTDATTGLATQVSNIIDETAKVSSGSPGSLVKLAGAASLVDKNSTIGRQMDGIDELLERLQATYDNEKERYWNEFNTMEQLISQMNQQSSWLASQFAG